MGKIVISADEFRMWRAVLAFSVVDHELSMEEQKIISSHIMDIDFTAAQLKILRNDMAVPQDVEKLFNQIQEKQNKEQFCALARTLVWCEGDIDRQEKEILKRVSCLGHKENEEILRGSTESEWMKNYIKQYEDMSFMKPSKPHPLFQITA